MDTLFIAIVTAVITASGTIIAAKMMYNAKINDIYKAVGVHLPKEHNNLFKENEKLSDEHRGLSGEHVKILTSQSAIISELQGNTKTTDQTSGKVSELYTIASTERTKQDERYANLNDRNKDISNFLTNGMDAVKSLQHEMEDLNIDKINLSEKLSKLIIENATLHADNAQLDEKVEQLSTENDKLVDQCNKLVAKCKQLVGNRPQPPTHTHITHEF